MTQETEKEMTERRTETKIGVTQPQAKECQEPPVAGGGKKDPFLETSEQV